MAQNSQAPLMKFGCVPDDEPARSYVWETHARFQKGNEITALDPVKGDWVTFTNRTTSP